MERSVFPIPFPFGAKVRWAVFEPRVRCSLGRSFRNGNGSDACFIFAAAALHCNPNTNMSCISGHCPPVRLAALAISNRRLVLTAFLHRECHLLILSFLPAHLLSLCLPLLSIVHRPQWQPRASLYAAASAQSSQNSVMSHTCSLTLAAKAIFHTTIESRSVPGTKQVRGVFSETTMTGIPHGTLSNSCPSVWT